nr:AraC family transcriptional regulator [uncultured Polaribacter sp.]
MWIVEENGVFNVDLKSFPVGYSFINIIDGDPFSITNKGNEYQTKSYLAGSNMTFFNIKMSYIRRALTIQLQPYAIPYLFGVPASEFLNEIVSLNDFKPELSLQLEELISSPIASSEVLKFVDNILLASSAKNPISKRITHALHLLMKSGGDIKIEDLSNQLNISQRRLQQLFNHNFGLTAKAYSRIVKMQYHTFQILNGKDLNTIIPNGYYDQSHFIHELKNLTGLLPNDFYKYLNKEEHKMAYLTSNLYF